MFFRRRLLVATSLLLACSEITGPKAPSTPANVTVTLVTPTSATISWSANPQNEGVNSYSILRNAVKIGESVSTSYTDTGLRPQTTYVYSVAAISKDGLISPPSTETTASTVTTLDVTKPTVVTTQPALNSTGVALNATASVTFSELMDPASINTSSFSLKTASGTAIPGTVVYAASNMTAEFRPTIALPSSAVITATVLTDAKDVAGNTLAAPYTWSFTTLDETPPAVSSVAPANGATGVSSGIAVQVTFSENMDAATINATNITLKTTSSSMLIAGAVSYNASTRTATFTPSAALAQLTGYTVTVSGVKDVAGNALAAPFNSTFTTGDTNPPSVTGFAPRDGVADVALDTKVKVTFSEAMDAATINSNTIKLLNNSTGQNVAFSVAYDAATTSATLTPSSLLTGFTGYTIIVTTGVKDVAGNPLVNQFISVFTTTVTDTNAPTVVSVSPANGATGAPAGTVVQITFSKAMDQATINGTNITLKTTSAGTAVAGIVVYNAGTLVGAFYPSAPLAPLTGYTVTATTGLKDVLGNSLPTTFTSTFTTGPAVGDITPPTVIEVVPPNGVVGVATNAVVQITFSEEMDATTINGANINLSNTSSRSLIAATITYNASTHVVTITPTAPLAMSTNYTVSVGTGAKDVAGNSMAGGFSSNFGTISPDMTPPTVVANTPSDLNAPAPITVLPSFSFSEPMDQSTINMSNFTFTVAATGEAVSGSLSYDAGTNSAIFTPSAPLAYSTRYTMTVSAGVRDLAGNALQAGRSFSFTTVKVPDTTPPTIVSRNPDNGQTGVALNANVKITFSEPMYFYSINEYTITLAKTSAPATLLTTVVQYDQETRTATLDPYYDLAYNTSYTVTVTSNVQDSAGLNPIAPSAWTFTTIPDTTPPVVTETSPANGSTGVLVANPIIVTFSEPMDPATINATTFTVRDNVTSTNITGTVSYNASAQTAKFAPSSVLLASRSYTVTVTTGAKDLAGNGLVANAAFSFTTNQDGIAPSVISTSPADGATNVPVTGLVVKVTFSEDIDPSTLNKYTFIVNDAVFQSDLAGTITYDAATRTATFVPTSIIFNDRKYYIEVTTFLKDLAGNGFPQNTVFSFRTAP